MNGKPTRRFFQMHLSTALVLMFAAGVLAWANVVKREGINVCVVTNGAEEAPTSFESLCFGWPYDCSLIQYHYEGQRDYADWRWSEVLRNVLVALAILIVVWRVCESWIRLPISARRSLRQYTNRKS